VRIIRGIYKTRYYKVPKGFPSRPTTDFAKEGLFNVIENLKTLDDLSILDLCAGTGNISIEFLSRESGSVIAIDSHFNTVKHLKKVADELGCANDLTIYKMDMIKYLEKSDLKFDLIFADPPYSYANHDKIVELVQSKDMLHENGLLIIEHGKDTNLEKLANFMFIKKYGAVHFSFFNK
jgi:16S rRNA (guanine(966)-N(2))-methyltransferase RsmD